MIADALHQRSWLRIIEHPNGRELCGEGGWRLQGKFHTQVDTYGDLAAVWSIRTSF